jgi:hypothetical protein
MKVGGVFSNWSSQYPIYMKTKDAITMAKLQALNMSIEE